MLRILKTTCNYRVNPVGLDTPVPFFGYLAEGDGGRAAAYRIRLGADADLSRPLWDSGWVGGEENDRLPYGGPALSPHTRYFYRVRCRSGLEESPWSETAYFETAFLPGSEWRAKFINAGEADACPGPSPCTLFRREFSLPRKAVHAALSITARGMYALTVNGEKPDDSFFAPGFKSYGHRLPYQTYDVTGLLREGRNCLGVLLGDGWYRGYINWNFRRNFYGNRRELLLELRVTLENGETVLVCSDGRFTWRPSPVGVSEFYIGETYDARKELPGWDLPGGADGFLPVRVLDGPDGTLSAAEAPCVTPVMRLKPAALLRTPKNELVLDMGQNMVGVLSFTVSGARGQRVRLRHGEVLDRDGNFYDENIKNSVGPSSQLVVYTLSGNGVERFTPHFTYQAFRYVLIEEFPGEPSPDQFEGLALSSMREQTCRFECSDPAVNRLYENVLWSQRGNFMDIPIAGPQRGERAGWTGDAQIFAPAACLNMDTRLFFGKWLDDVINDQFEDGGVGWMVPQICHPEDYASDRLENGSQRYPTSAAWGDAALIVPWTLYTEYGDTAILRRQFDSMRRYVEYMRHSGHHEYAYDTGTHYGDWFALDGDDYYGATPKPYIATAYYHRSTEILAKTCALLGETALREEYAALLSGIRNELARRYLEPDGALNVHTQTACVLALQFGLFPAECAPRITEQLCALLEKKNLHLDTGFVGTPYLCEVLAENGRADYAGKLLFNRDCPSWLYQVDHGATTIWEHWNGIKEDGSFWDPWMNSFNHYAYGSIGKWLVSGVCGVRSDEKRPGYRHFFWKPVLLAQLAFAQAELQTSAGRIFARWEQQDGILHGQLTVPFGAHCTLLLPDGPGLAGRLAACGLTPEGKGGRLCCEAGPGDYAF